MQLFKKHHSLGVLGHAPVNDQLLPIVLHVFPFRPDTLSYELRLVLLVDDVFGLLLGLSSFVLEVLLLPLSFIVF